MTMATLSKILEGGSYKSMITAESSIIRVRKTSITAAKNKNIITHSKLKNVVYIYPLMVLYFFIISSTIN